MSESETFPRPHLIACLTALHSRPRSAHACVAVSAGACWVEAIHESGGAVWGVLRRRGRVGGGLCRTGDGGGDGAVQRVPHPETLGQNSNRWRSGVEKSIVDRFV